LDILLLRLEDPNEILDVERVILKFQTSGWLGDRSTTLPDQIVDAAIRIDRADWALDLLRDNSTLRMFPNLSTFNKLMSHYAKDNDLPGVTTVWQLQKQRGFKANAQTVYCLLSVYLHSNELSSVAWILERTLNTNLLQPHSLNLLLKFIVSHPRETVSVRGASSILGFGLIKQHIDQQELCMDTEQSSLLALSAVQEGLIDDAISITKSLDSSHLTSFFECFVQNAQLSSENGSIQQHITLYLEQLEQNQISVPQQLIQLKQTESNQQQNDEQLNEQAQNEEEGEGEGENVQQSDDVNQQEANQIEENESVDK